MKKSVFIFSLLFALSLSNTSCDLNNIKLPDNNINRLKWVYNIGDISVNSLPNPVPAIDEDNNIYAYVSNHSKDDFIKLNSLGKGVWSRNGGGITSRIVYSNNLLYYVKNSTSIACSRASDGTEVWVTDHAINGNRFAVTDTRIYTTDFRDNGFLGVNYIKAFDLDGIEKWEKEIRYSDTDTINFPYAISVNGSDIYVGVLEETNNSSFAILKYKDNGDEAIKLWSWLAPEDFTTEGVNGRFNDIAIDDSGNILFAMSKDGTQFIFSVSSNGTENWHTETAQEKVISFVTVDKQGNAYSSYSTTEKSGSAGKIWNTNLKSDWEFEGFSSKGPALSNNGNSYSIDDSKLLTAIDNTGKVLWEQHYEPGTNSGLSVDEQFQNITINRNGDIIIIGKFEIKCFKGDGSGLLEGGWPKEFGNYGNTASK